MNNIFGEYDIKKRYDLKGSEIGRRTHFEDGEIDYKVALKDLDFVDNREIVTFEDEGLKQHYIEVMESDARFLG